MNPIVLTAARPLIMTLKSTMEQYDSDGNARAIQSLIAKHSEIIIPLPFQVMDHDMPTDPDRNSEHCFWIIPEGGNVNDTEPTVVIISPQTDPQLFAQLLSYALAELISSHNAQQGYRAGYYINVAYAMVNLFEGQAV